MGFLEKVSKSDNRFLIIADRPGLYTARSFGAVSFTFANNGNALYSDIADLLYRNIYVIQDILYATGKPSLATELDSRYILKAVAESQNNRECFTRISKVASIKKSK